MNKVICILLVFLSALITTSFAQSNKNFLTGKVLIVVHMQEDSLSKESDVESIDRINQLIHDFEADNVIYAKIVHKVLNLTLKKIYVDKIETDLNQEINIVSQNVFIDYNGDIFSSNKLNDFLVNKNVKQVVIVGRSAEGCIKSSVLSGLKLGYEMYIVPDAIIGKSEESKLKVFKKLEKNGAKILQM